MLIFNTTNFYKFFSCLDCYKHKILLFILAKLESDLQCFYLINVIESEWFLQSFLLSWYILSLNQSSKAVMKIAFSLSRINFSEMIKGDDMVFEGRK